MSFWNSERCEYCGGAIIEKTVILYRRVRDRHVLVENVPAGVCVECGMRYYTANVLKTVEESLHGRREMKQEVLAPVYSF